MNIIVAFRKLEDAQKIRNVLVRNGFTVSVVTTSALAALHEADTLGSALVICSVQLSDMRYTDLREALPVSCRMLLITRGDALPLRSGDDIVCLTQPLKSRELLETVSMLTSPRAASRRRRAKERTGEEQEVINKAKALLMERNHMTEPEAHRYLQKTSMDTGRSLLESAYMVLELF